MWTRWRNALRRRRAERDSAVDGVAKRLRGSQGIVAAFDVAAGVVAVVVTDGKVVGSAVGPGYFSSYTRKEKVNFWQALAFRASQPMS